MAPRKSRSDCRKPILDWRVLPVVEQLKLWTTHLNCGWDTLEDMDGKSDTGKGVDHVEDGESYEGKEKIGKERDV